METGSRLVRTKKCPGDLFLGVLLTVFLLKVSGIPCRVSWWVPFPFGGGEGVLSCECVRVLCCLLPK